MALIQMNYQEFKRDFGYSAQAVDKAAQSAAKTVAYALKVELQKEIRQSTIAGVRMKAMREISMNAALRRRSYSRGGGKLGKIPGGDRPLWMLQKVVRYNVPDDRETLFHSEVGFVSPPKAPISRNWMNIAYRQQEGATFKVPSALRRHLKLIGAGMKKAGDPKAKFYFLRKSTESFTDPAREIVDPFAAAHQQFAIETIRQRFEMKLKGEWIAQGRMKWPT
jgi:hypothetical protein